MQNLERVNVKGKKIFLRADLDVPIVDGKFKDDFRLLSVAPTIEYLLKQGAKIIIAGHLGRPKGIDKSLSLEPVAKWFFKEFKTLNLKFEFKLKIENLKLAKLGDFEGWQITPNLFLLENLRFYEDEEKNDLEFARKLAAFADVYVNEAFANSHRNHASIVGVPKYLPHFPGFHLQKEVEVLSDILKSPKRPLTVVIGGAKLETKLPLVSKMHELADYVLIGGKLAGETKELLKIQHEKITLTSGRKKSALLVADLNKEGLDITPKSVENFLQIIALARTVVWNGPLGKISEDKKTLAKSEEGSKKLAEGLVKSQAYVVVGGGDTVGFLEKACLLDRFACLPKSRYFLSTGGGAMLAFLSGGKLPGLEALL